MTHSQNGLARWVRDLPPGFAALAPQPDSFGRGKVQRYMGTFTHPSLPSATFPPFSRLPPPSFPREQQKPSRPTHFSLDFTHTTTNFCPRTPANSSLRDSRLQPTSSAHLPCNDFHQDRCILLLRALLFRPSRKFRESSRQQPLNKTTLTIQVNPSLVTNCLGYYSILSNLSHNPTHQTFTPPSTSHHQRPIRKHVWQA